MAININDGKWLSLSVTIILFVMGAFESKTLSILHRLLYTSWMLISLIGSIFAFFNTSDTLDKLQTIGVFSTTLMLNCVVSAILANRHKIKTIISSLQENAAGKTYIINRAARLANKKLLFLAFFHGFASVFFFVPPSIYFMTKPLLKSYETQEVIQFWFTCGTEERRGIRRSLCWNVETKRELMIKNMITSSMAAIEEGGFFCGIVLYCVVMAEFYVHLDIFRAKIVALSQYSDQFSVDLYRHTRDQKWKRSVLSHHKLNIEKMLVKIVHYQQFLRCCIKEINSTFEGFTNIFFIASYGVSVVLIILVFFQTHNRILLFRHIPISAIMFVTIGMFCYFGQLISDLNDILLYELSKIPWYQQEIQFRKNYILALNQNYLPLQTKFFNSRVINLSFMLSVFRTLYSIINVLLLMIRK
ncbi:uncharacterized protein LOC135847717 [Planococcus citri]|uniref:uncharacterized protein LOC135847717 n=1 Tax=Planococcus citri TaxID=170843 RepID=UPI0031F86309